ncbi:uncharacterized protein BP01DRAFT_360540 [Aspergillus saccharolyticus JOP 1030-1]|uniref:Uncharacterized protein n=1 Tax=Aspergillus saccharolyticus JOP 1030-1 TaxID=1450539 RepID=A0A318Z1V2_9EURO|nr:hypothetical protein BP01DRAFT_360540 [Aspergillus saccharolyticus JOP 1030-1]PYH41265.1 hypothetical protein BP01DRAFT_360540 [Aspergillus saccharolyticus JOP 1030-1]
MYSLLFGLRAFFLPLTDPPGWPALLFHLHLPGEIKIISVGHVWHLTPGLFCTFPMIHADRVLLANLSSLPLSPSQRPSSLRARDQLETLIARHGHPPRVSLSSLEELTATSSTYSPPSPQSPVSDTTDYLATPSLNPSASRPIPIPKRSHSTQAHDFPVTPLTGRFDKGYYFAQREQALERSRDKPAHRQSSRPGHRPHFSESSRMRSDSSTLYAPVATPAMSSGRPLSPQPSRARGGNPSKTAPSFQLGSLPRFHPAVYQGSGTSQTLSAQPPSSPRQSRQHGYRASAGSRDSLFQYRELADGNTLVKAPSRPLSPSAPRLDPLRSPGPVTPLALEDAGGYLGSGTTADTARESHYSGPAPDVVERLIAREAERARQKARKGLKGY